MSFEEEFRSIRGQSKIGEYSCVTENFYNSIIKNMLPVEQQCISYTEFIKELNSKGVNSNNLHCNINSFPLIIYNDGFLVIAIWIEPNLMIENFINSITIQREKLYHLWNIKDYENFFILYDNHFCFDFFIKNYKKIGKSKVYKVFKNIYTKNDIGCGVFSKEIVEYVYENKDRKELRRKLNSMADKNGYIRIYRGEGSHSTTKENAYSWTINIITAHFFAFRVSQNGTVYRGKVHKSKVLDFIDRREEDEIIVEFDDVEDIKQINKYSTNHSDFPTIDKIIDEYKKVVNLLKILKVELFEPEGIHGLLHIQRVVLLTLLMSHKLNFSVKDKNILIMSALLHDIARDNDGTDYIHGKNAVNKIESIPYISKIFEINFSNKEDGCICKQIISGHSIDDTEAEAQIIDDNSIENKNRAIKLLRYFKDLDALDRVRLRTHLDEKYFRYEETIDFIGVAYELLMNIEIIK